MRTMEHREKLYLLHSPLRKLHPNQTVHQKRTFQIHIFAIVVNPSFFAFTAFIWKKPGQVFHSQFNVLSEHLVKFQCLLLHNKKHSLLMEQLGGRTSILKHE